MYTFIWQFLAQLIFRMQNIFKTILSPYTRNGTSKKDGYAYNKSHMTVFRYFERIEKNMDMNKSNFTNPIQL